MMQVATVLICAVCERAAVIIGEGHLLDRAMFTTVVLCWQCGKTGSKCPVRGIGSIMTALLLADSPALNTVASSFAPDADGIFWHAYVSGPHGPPRDSVLAATVPPLGETRLPVVGIRRIEEGLVGEYQLSLYVDRRNAGDCGDFFSSDMTK